MKRLCVIFIVGSTSCLVSCKVLDYEVPATINCRLLSSVLFCIDQETGEEFDIPLSEGIGFACRSAEDDTKLSDFGIQLMKENKQFSNCKTKECVSSLVKQHNATVELQEE